MAAREVIANADVVFVSAASAWEAAIKASLGKLSIPAPFETGIDASGFERLDVTFPHAAEVANLPWHHRDPFDRLLVAQALTERLTLVTHDHTLAAYPIDVLLS